MSCCSLVPTVHRAVVLLFHLCSVSGPQVTDRMMMQLIGGESTKAMEILHRFDLILVYGNMVHPIKEPESGFPHVPAFAMHGYSNSGAATQHYVDYLQVGGH